MKRRNILRTLATLPLAGVLPALLATKAAHAVTLQPNRRVRPSDSAWPSSGTWEGLNREVSGRLLKLESPFVDCGAESGDAACREALDHIKNPYFIGDQPALTQASGWVDAWTSRPSAFAVAAVSTADVVAAVNFARQHNLRLVIKGGCPYVVVNDISGCGGR
jgi:hypothetical protein